MKAARALWVGGVLCLGGIVVGAQFRAPAVAPAAADSTTSTEPQAESRLVASFTDFAGSEANARSLVAGLRQGVEITLTAPGTGARAAASTRFMPPTRPMDHGNVRTSLALGREQLAQLGIKQPTPVQIKAVLAGGAVTSRGAARTTPVLLPGVLQMRAHGMGWNRIADSMGVKLGGSRDDGKALPAKVALATGPTAPGIAASAVTVTGAQFEAPKQGRADGAPAAGSTRPGKVASATPAEAARPADAKPAESAKRRAPRAPAPADPISTTARTEKGGAGAAVATTSPAIAGLSQEMRSPATGGTAVRDNGIASAAAAVPAQTAADPVTPSPAARLETPTASGERRPEPAAPAD